MIAHRPSALAGVDLAAGDGARDKRKLFGPKDEVLAKMMPAACGAGGAA